MYTGIIYKATSPIGKIYYGQTIQKFQRRKSRHIRDAKNDSHYRIHQALRKYNFDFKWEIIETYKDNNKIKLIEKLNEREAYWVRKDKTNMFEHGYNSSLGGDNAFNERRPHSAESKDKIRQSLLGKKHTDERRKNLSNAHKGKDFSKNFGPPRYGKDNPSYVQLSKEQITKIIRLHIEEYKTAKQIGHIMNINPAKVLKTLREEIV
jgi:group I intron endonuclease